MQIHKVSGNLFESLRAQTRPQNQYSRHLILSSTTSGGRSDAVEDRRISHHNIVLIHPVNDLLIEVRWNAEDRGYSRETGGAYSNTLSIEWKEGVFVLENKQQSKV